MTDLKVEDTTIVQAPAGGPTHARNGRKFDIAVIVTGAIAIALVLTVLFADLDRAVIGLLVIALMLALMLTRIPVGIAMVLASAVGLWRLASMTVLESSLSELAFGSVASWSYSVIPMFVLMGIALGKSGLTASAYRVAQKWLGRLPGGLALATNFTGAGFAASSGSTIGITFAIGRVAIPEMIRLGYKPTLATGSVAMAGTLGQVIPPSILLVIYAGVAGVPVGPQLVAGIVPGLILATAFGLVIVLWATLRPSVAGRAEEGVSWGERLTSLVHLAPVAAVVAVVMGGIYMGVFTATEAGAFGAAMAVIFGLFAVLRARKKSGASVWGFFSGTFMETVASVAAMFMLLIGVHLLTRVMTISGLAQSMADFVVDLGLSRLTFLLLLVVIYIILGMFIDTLAMMLLTIPIFMGPLLALDVDLLWFGVFLVVLAEIGLVTPPLGVLAFIVHGIAESSTRGMGVQIRLTDVFKGVLPFVIAAFLVLLLIIFFPEIVTWLPGMSNAS